MKRVIGSLIIVLAAASFAGAAPSVNVDVNTPGASIRVGTPAPPPRVTVVEHERVIVKEHRGDNGKHKGHRKHKKHKQDHHDERGGHDRH
jgi:hypothetical protein